jgi:hypothetical protein
LNRFKVGWAKLVGPWERLRCISSQTVHLHSAQDSIALIDEYAKTFVGFAYDVVTKDIHAWWSLRFARDLEVEACAAANAAPGRCLRSSQLLYVLKCFGLSMLKHPQRKCALVFSERAGGRGFVHDA